MQAPITFHQRKRGIYITAGFLWFGIIMLALMLLNFVLPRPSDPTLTTTSLLWIVGFFVFWIIIFVIALNTSYRTLTLQGSLLTIARGKWWKSKTTIDLQHVVQVSQVSLETGRSRIRFLIFKDDQGHNMKFDLSYFAPADRDLLLPALTELLNRPGLQLRGMVTSLLSKWYGAKAPKVPPH